MAREQYFFIDSKEIDARISFEQSIADAKKTSEEVEAVLAEPTVIFEGQQEKKGKGKNFRSDTPLYTIYLGSSDGDGGSPSQEKKKKEANRFKQGQRKTRRNSK